MFASGKTAAVASAANYIEDVFSTYLYTGNSTSGGTQTITNSIDLSTKGGMVWIKGRSAASNNILNDTTRGAGVSATNNNALASNLTSAEDLGGSSYDYLSSFSTTGFVVTQGGTTTATRGTNYNNVTYASWTFRKQAKFFDVVTFTTGSSLSTNQRISHSLGSVPGSILVKRTNDAQSWLVYHRSTGRNAYLLLDTTDASTSLTNAWGTSDPTSTDFGINENALCYPSSTYVAYLFAHDAGGFGLTGTDNVISCGTFTGNSAGDPVAVNLGYEAQWVMHKRTNGTGDWAIFDSMRGAPTDQPSQDLLANSSAAEVDGYKGGYPTSTGFVAYPEGTGSPNTYIYIAIRRGPMKVPTSGTSVFGTNARTGTGANATVTGGQTDDAVLIKNRGSAVADLFSSRLTGTGYLVTSSTAAEVAAGTTILQANPWDVMDGVKVGTTSTITNASSNTFINYLFKRAPSFFDEVCWTGTNADQTINHNLGVVPEMIIFKDRTNADSWRVGTNFTSTNWLSSLLDLTNAGTTYGYAASTRQYTAQPTATQFFVGQNFNSYATLVAYLFATCAGVSKVGSYTGTGTTKQVDCGFTAGARFVLIKRTDSTGDWYVWDSARGIVSGNDPYLLLNSTAAEVTNTDYVDTYSAGFEISSTAPAAINANGGTFIFLAIA